MNICIYIYIYLCHVFDFQNFYCLSCFLCFSYFVEGETGGAVRRKNMQNKCGGGQHPCHQRDARRPKVLSNSWPHGGWGTG